MRGAIHIAAAALAGWLCASCSTSHSGPDGGADGGADAGGQYCEMDWDTVIIVEPGGPCVEEIITVLESDDDHCEGDMSIPPARGHSVRIRPADGAPDLGIAVERERVFVPDCGVPRRCDEQGVPLPGSRGCTGCLSFGFWSTTTHPESSTDPLFRRLIYAPAGLVVRIRACPLP